MEDAANQRFGRYQVTGQLGRGGMAVVYRAVDPQLNREVAIKVIGGARNSFSGESVERFQRELKSMALIAHPNVVRIFDGGTEQEMPFLVTELIEGETLEQLVRKNGRMPIGKLLRFTRELLEALVAVHEAGLVHRDIKPSNLMVTAEERLVLMDFGIALAAFGDSLTKTGDVPGTLAYLPPECLGGKKAAVASDLFQVGLVAYEMIVGKPLLTLQNPKDFLLAHGELPPKDLRTRREDLPSLLEATIRKALEPDPAARFQSAREMLEALEGGEVTQSRRSRVTGRKPVTSSGLHTPARAPAPVGRGTAMAAAAGFGAVALLGVAGWFAYAALWARPEPPAIFEAKVSAQGLEVSWQSGRAYRGAIELTVPEAGVLIAEENGETKSHRVTVPGDFQGLTAEVRAGVADGTFGESRKLGPGQ